ncbi:MAG: hypothetical protein WAQ25_03540 [Candidatus Saccharimonas sp.]
MVTATVQVESFRRPVDVPIPTQDERQKTAQAAYEKAGLVALAQGAPGFAATKERLASADLLYGELSKGDLVVWRAYLPTSYGLSEYRYDVPPEEVALAIADARALKLFDRIEIWTSEGSGIGERVGQFYRRAADKVHHMLEIAADPMAVGVINLGDVAHYFPIVRWGEALHSFSRIKTTVRLRTAAVFTLTKLPFVVLGLVVLGLLAWAFAVTWWEVGAWAILLWVVGAFVLAVVTLPIWARR